jgi:PLP dependent protein
VQDAGKPGNRIAFPIPSKPTPSEPYYSTRLSLQMLVAAGGRLVLSFSSSRVLISPLTRRRFASSRMQTTSPSADDAAVASALSEVSARIAAASISTNRSSKPRLVAVSKMKPAAAVRAAYAAGQRHFGENYVQEVAGKAKELEDLVAGGLKWHYIGALQSNKAKALLAVPGLWCIETVDRIKIAGALQKAAEGAGWITPLRVLVQVNTSDEESKSGCDVEAAGEVAEYVMNECGLLQLGGLMTIGAPGDSDAFAVLADVRDKVAERLSIDKSSLELSMGMSGDFEEAIRMRSDSVRIGSTIFGARSYPAHAAVSEKRV